MKIKKYGFKNISIAIKIEKETECKRGGIFYYITKRRKVKNLKLFVATSLFL